MYFYKTCPRAGTHTTVRRQKHVGKALEGGNLRSGEVAVVLAEQDHVAATAPRVEYARSVYTTCSIYNSFIHTMHVDYAIHVQ